MQLLGLLHFTTGKVSVGLGLQRLMAKSSTPYLGLELDHLSGIGIENRGIPRAIDRRCQAAEATSAVLESEFTAVQNFPKACQHP